jgi:hypothetical protein
LTPLEKARLAPRGPRLDPMARAATNPTSLRLAINGKCWDCQGGNADPGVNQRIRDCTSEKTCSLWPVRPYREA